MEALHGFDEGGLDHMDSYLGSDEEGLCGSGGYGGMAGLASFNALGLDDMRDDVGLLDNKRGKVGGAGSSLTNVLPRQDVSLSRRLLTRNCRLCRRSACGTAARVWLW